MHAYIVFWEMFERTERPCSIYVTPCHAMPMHRRVLSNKSAKEMGWALNKMNGKSG